MRWENTPEEVVRLRDDARLHPFAGLFPNDSRRRGGRAHPRSIPDFSTLEGRLTIRAALDDRFALDGYVPLRRPITHRLEAYNNELRLRHFLPLDRFAEALVVPAAEYEAIRDAFIRRGFSALLAGVPLDDFLIPAVRLDALAPVIDADRLAIPLGGFEYLLRESRLPEYRIWKRARECGDTLTLLDLWLELNHGPGFRRLLAAPGLLTSLRERLRDPALPPESPERAALLAAYRSWAAAPDHRDEADPPPIAALFARCREAVVRRAMRMRSITGIDDIPETLVVGDPRVEGIRPDGATLLAEPSFLAAARIGAGRAGLAHLFTLELFAATSLRNDPARLYAATSATLEELGFRPAWEPLMEALDLSASRRERIRSLLAEAAHRSR